MAGGAEQYLNDVVAFDDIESVWSSLSPSGTPPVARAYCRMVGAASERKLWVFGGQSASTGALFSSPQLRNRTEIKRDNPQGQDEAWTRLVVACFCCALGLGCPVL
eukprot:3187118-Rhodomonas_salina.5